MLAYLALQAVILPVYLLVLPYFYGLPRLGGAIPILIFAIPFVLAVAGLGFVVAGVFRQPLRVQLILGPFPGSRSSWRQASHGQAKLFRLSSRLVSYLVPSTSAIDGFVKLSQLGAPLSAVKPDFITLWCLAVVYNGFAVVLASGNRGLSPGCTRYDELGRLNQIGASPATEAAASVLAVDPAFTISAFIARGGQSNAKLLIEGLRKAGLPE